MSVKNGKKFTESMFTCTCGCGLNKINQRFITALDSLQELLGLPIQIVSGCRCKNRKGKCGDKYEEYHASGKAVDIAVRGVSPDVVAGVADQVEGIKSCGIGIYDKFVHLDLARGKRRWRG